MSIFTIPLTEEIDEERESISSYQNQESPIEIISKHKILLNLLQEMEQETQNPNLKIKMKNLSDDLLEELNSIPNAKENVKMYFQKPKKESTIKKLLKKLSPKKKEKVKEIKEEPKIIPIKPLREISEKFDSISKENQEEVLNISKIYYDNLKQMSDNYYKSLENGNKNEIDKIEKTYKQDTIDAIKSLRNNIVSLLPKNNKNTLSEIHKIINKKIQNLEEEKYNQLEKELNIQQQILIRDTYNNKINELKDILGFYKGIAENQSS
jgi:hypothetical protein